VAAIAYWPSDAVKFRLVLHVKHHADVLPPTQVVWENKVWLIFFSFPVLSLHETWRIISSCVTLPDHFNPSCYFICPLMNELDEPIEPTLGAELTYEGSHICLASCS